MKSRRRLFECAVVIALLFVALGLGTVPLQAQLVINNGNVVTVPVVSTEVNAGGQPVLVGPSGNLVLQGGPTIAELNGDFSALALKNPPEFIFTQLTSICGSATPCAYPGNMVPVGLLGPGTFVPTGGNANVGAGAGTVAPSVTVDGAGSEWSVGNVLTVESTGSLNITNGGAVSVGWVAPNSPQATPIGSPTGAVANSGMVTIGSGSSLSVCCTNIGVGTYTQAAGSTDVNGTLFAQGGVYVNGGTLSGSGTVNASVINGATVYPGDPTTLTITGNYTQTANGVLVIDVSSATDFTTLDVTGNATLDGTVEFDFLNGFVPGANTNFAFLDVAGSVSGDFTGFDFSGIKCPTCTFSKTTLSLDTGGTPPAPSPEPASLVLFATGLLGLAWALWRRQAAQVRFF